MPTQKFTQQDIDQLSAWFQRNYDAAFAWKTAIAAHLAMPGLRAHWPMSAVANTQPECIDVSGNGNHLQAAAALGNVDFGFDANSLAPIAEFFGAANSYLFKADAGAFDWADILGNENYIRTNDRGLCLGGWFWWSALPGANQGLISKQAGANNSYDILLQATNIPIFRVWPGPVGVASAAAISTGWNHIAGRYDQPTQTVFIYLNGVETSGVVGAAPAALTDSPTQFTIGASASGGNLFTGYASLCFLCASQATAGRVQGLYQQPRALFGV